MNRIYLLIILLGYSFASLNAQKIIVDRIEKDGSHQIMVKAINFSIDGVKYSAGMKVFETPYSKKDWMLFISSYHYIPNSAAVLLKLGNDEVIYLPVNNVSVGKVTMPCYGVTIGTITSISPSTTVDYYTSIYNLSDIDMDKIDTYGIIKIRISDGVEYRDKTYGNNSLGKYLKKCRKNIKRRLENPLRTNNLFDNF